eukprot:364555-Chlamydomonas_euryale.AAC.6
MESTERVIARLCVIVVPVGVVPWALLCTASRQASPGGPCALVRPSSHESESELQGADPGRGVWEIAALEVVHWWAQESCDMTMVLKPSAAATPDMNVYNTPPPVAACMRAYRQSTILDTSCRQGRALCLRVYACNSFEASQEARWPPGRPQLVYRVRFGQLRDATSQV